MRERAARTLDTQNRSTYGFCTMAALRPLPEPPEAGPDAGNRPLPPPPEPTSTPPLEPTGAPYDDRPDRFDPGGRRLGHAADPGREGIPDQRRRGLRHLGRAPGRCSGHHPLRRAARTASAEGGGRRRATRPAQRRPRHLLPARRGTRQQLGPGARPSRRRSARGRGDRARRPGAAGSGHQHQALAALRAQLRVLLRGPAAHRRAGRGHGARTPGVRCGRGTQALRGQQPGDRPDAGQRRHRRAPAARDLPPRLRTHRPPRPPLVRDVRLQRRQRRDPLGEHPAADRHPAHRVGLRRHRDVRLGSRTRPGRRPPRGSGPPDARDPGAHRRRGRGRRAGRLPGRVGAGHRRGAPGPLRPARHGRLRASRAADDRGRPPPPRRGGGGAVRGPAQERGRAAAAEPGRGKRRRHR